MVEDCFLSLGFGSAVSVNLEIADCACIVLGRPCFGHYIGGRTVYKYRTFNFLESLISTITSSNVVQQLALQFPP